MSNRTYPQGVPCWIDTQQADVDAAVAFYGGLSAVCPKTQCHQQRRRRW
jgi:hypothetical protein